MGYILRCNADGGLALFCVRTLTLALSSSSLSLRAEGRRTGRRDKKGIREISMNTRQLLHYREQRLSAILAMPGGLRGCEQLMGQTRGG